MGKAAIRSTVGESLVNWEAWGAHEMAGTSVAKQSQNQGTLFPFPSFCKEWRTVAQGKKETWSLVLLKAAPGSVHWDSRGLWWCEKCIAIWMKEGGSTIPHQEAGWQNWFWQDGKFTPAALESPKAACHYRNVGKRHSRSSLHLPEVERENNLSMLK